MKKLFYITAGIATILLVLYTYIGGFTAPEVSLTTSETLYVAGQPYHGAVDDAALGNAFKRAAEALDNKELEGVPGNIFYNDPDKSGDSLRAFIGVIIPDATVALPAGYELRTVPGGRQVIHVEVNANIAIAPKKLYGAVADYAKEQELQFEDFYVEWYPASDRAVVEVPVKQ
ncbi:GyrI-like domain-containing protein [Pontibacter sp. E15-1]|uniref:GyrI-like domain-containing protein n=1 Tax=Pontibacter sp. E15-1 TaxID=2919918 RepID=UPI001F4F33CF|nr:GyrI-like domain-containing protein [Pontibacter sp. E15-1]MCJ8166837.1 GyrI-like domain-containing protein [Pontibacter sp. E15-1]